MWSGWSAPSPPPPPRSVFLLRDSQTNPKTFVLSLCHAHKVKHFQIVPVSTTPPPPSPRRAGRSLFSPHGADGRRGRPAVQPGRRQHALHGPDPAGGLLPAEPRRAALQAQAPLRASGPVSSGAPPPSPRTRLTDPRERFSAFGDDTATATWPPASPKSTVILQ